jgi:hypothetical protein
MNGKSKKVKESIPHPRAGRAPLHADWRRHISMGVREAKLRRRASGLLTFIEAGVEMALPEYSVKRMADLGQLHVVKVGIRRYVPHSEVVRFKTECNEQ